MTYTLNAGRQIARNGQPLAVLVASTYGDGAVSPTVLDTLARDTVAALNAAAIVREMLVWEADRFDAVPIGYQVGIAATYPTRAEAEACCAMVGMRPDSIEEIFGDLNVSGADLVDAFTDWRLRLRAAMEAA